MKMTNEQLNERAEDIRFTACKILSNHFVVPEVLGSKCRITQGGNLQLVLEFNAGDWEEEYDPFAE